MSVDMKVVSIPADGDCLYHAFIKGLGLDGLTPKMLRDFVADKIISDHDLYDDLIMEWLDFNLIQDKECMTQETAAQRIRSTKDWATSTIIHILAVSFNVRIIVFQKIKDTFYSEVFPSEWKQKSQDVENDKLKPPPCKDIFLYRRGYHFELLLPLSETEMGHVDTYRRNKISKQNTGLNSSMFENSNGMLSVRDAEMGKQDITKRYIQKGGYSDKESQTIDIATAIFGVIGILVCVLTF